MMLPKTRRRIAALEAHNAVLEQRHDEKDEQIGDLISEVERVRAANRTARNIAHRARTTYLPLSMPYQHLTNVVLTLDGRDPLS